MNYSLKDTLNAAIVATLIGLFYVLCFGQTETFCNGNMVVDGNRVENCSER